MNKYRILNLIRTIPLIPFIVAYRIITFILAPIIAVLIFFITDWEDEFDRNYYIRQFKKAVSFGFWK